MIIWMFGYEPQAVKGTIILDSQPRIAFVRFGCVMRLDSDTGLVNV